MLNVHPLGWAIAPVAFGILVPAGCGKQKEASAPVKVSSTEVIGYGCESGKPPKSPKIGGL